MEFGFGQSKQSAQIRAMNSSVEEGYMRLQYSRLVKNEDTGKELRV